MAGYGPANVQIYSFVPWPELQPGDFVYGNLLCSIPPIGSESIITDGGKFIQIDPGTGLIVNIGLCP
jgi:hypothetical protein